MRWKTRPEGSSWGEYGPDDQLGRANELTPERTRRAVLEVREGISFCLSLPLDYPGKSVLNPRRFPPVLRPTFRNARVNYVYRYGEDDPRRQDITCDDAAILYLQYSSQWDGLAHYGEMFDADGDGVPEPLFYNGWRGGVDVVGGVSSCHADKLGVENMAEKCMQGRGIMVDLFAHYGRTRKVVGYDDLMTVLKKDSVQVEAGDMLCLHTGFAQMLLEMKKNPNKELLDRSCAVLDGNDARLLGWIGESRIASLVCDNYAVEAPAEAVPPDQLPMGLHRHCLFKVGVNLAELWHLTPLAEWLRAHNRYRFLLTAPPLRLTGAIGSPPVAVATV